MKKKLNLDRQRLAGVAAAASTFVGASAAQAGIQYQSVDVDIPGEVADFSIDFNSNGTKEFDIQHFDAIVKVADFQAGAGVARDGSNRVANLSAGTLIGLGGVFNSTGPDPLTGNSADANFQVSNGPGYIGAQFLLSGNTHYGYVGYQGTGAQGSANGRVFAIAYETTPNTAIAAGAVPEPSSLALLAAGAGGAALYRRRRAAQG